MSAPIVTKLIVLRRVNFQEADRIITGLSLDNGKLHLIVRGARRIKSKMAGGIELFGISQISYLVGRGELSTLVSARLEQQFPNIITNIDRTMFGYDIFKTIDRLTEDAAGPEYFELLENCFKGLNNLDLSLDLVELWYLLNLQDITGHRPNFLTDTEGQKLKPGARYNFDFDSMTMQPSEEGRFDANSIKLFRVVLAADNPEMLQKIAGIQRYLPGNLDLVRTLNHQYFK